MDAPVRSKVRKKETQGSNPKDEALRQALRRIANELTSRYVALLGLRSVIFKAIDSLQDEQLEQIREALRSLIDADDPSSGTA